MLCSGSCGGATVRNALRLAAASSSSSACGVRRLMCSKPDAALDTVQEQKPKHHWTEEFKIRSPKVPAALLRSESVVAVDIDSDAYADRRVAFVRRRPLIGGPIHPRVRGMGKILSWCGLASLPYLMFCKWAGGSPLFGDMPTYAVPITVAGVTLGYLGANLALERAVLHRRIFSVALDEVDPQLVYITMQPVGGWLHGQFKTYATRLDNIAVEPTGWGWAKLRFKKCPGLPSDADWFSLPTGRGKQFVIDARAMAAFSEACRLSAASGVAPGQSDLKQFDRLVLPSDAEIDRHLDSVLQGKKSEPEAADKPTGNGTGDKVN